MGIDKEDMDMEASYTEGKRFQAASFDAAIDVVTAAFQSVGFGLPPGTLNMNVSEVFTMKKVDDKFPKLQILGFCNPKFAHSLLLAEPAAALLIPCSVAIKEIVPGKVYEVAAYNIDKMGSLMSNQEGTQETVGKVKECVDAALLAIVDT
uniref:DUF302 domain-containing protein n=1 Tax=Aplanochytrium stocchinoi TaxID=215587 RepID=A0A7S3V2S8_9STRA|mmetsp:Transcript_3438/g.4331  ORF Transcript_3438/g.4331 Transcript_3438/m.4331 type:complete len:150 (+) Transcript_3438:186-635(+)